MVKYSDQVKESITKMRIEKQTPRRGFSFETNILTKSNIICGICAIIGGLAIGFGKSSHRPHKSRIKKSVGAAGGIFAALTAISAQCELNKIVKGVKEEQHKIEIEDAIPIFSEEDVYEYINSQNKI